MAEKIIGASIGQCVHVAGIINFLRLAEEQGYDTEFLGPAVSVEELLDAVLEADPQWIAVSYRLTPSVAAELFEELADRAAELGLIDKKFIFGGTKPVAQVAKETGFFQGVFSGEETIPEIIAFLKGGGRYSSSEAYPQSLVARLAAKAPYPLLRHHFGLPSLEETMAGAAAIAEAKVLDVLSIGPDQSAQESFFRPQELAEAARGAGGVPIRREEDLRAIYEATRRGNYPLLRCYSGTRDVLQWGEMLQRTINNAWCAVPLCWYNVLDKRGPRFLDESIQEAQQLMAWHGQRNIPVECNEAHHWSLRDAHDTIAVVMAFLGAYNAKAWGVKDYIAQYMFNTPPATSPTMDLAKMLAKKELIEGLVDDHFRVYTQVRAGLASFPVDLDEAKGQLGMATMLGMMLQPHIVHVVAYCEAQYAALPADVIASCRLARRVIENCLYDRVDIISDPRVQQRKEVLLAEAKILLQGLHALGEKMGSKDPWADHRVLAQGIKLGLIDAPHLRNTPPAKGQLQTRIIDGACVAIDPETKEPIGEEERLARLGLRR